MNYPARFVAAVKEEHSDWPELIAALDRGSPIVGRYLDDSAGWGFSAEVVLEAIEKGMTDSLKPKAEAIIRRRKLVEWWGELYEVYCAESKKLIGA